MFRNLLSFFFQDSKEELSASEILNQIDNSFFNLAPVKSNFQSLNREFIRLKEESKKLSGNYKGQVPENYKGANSALMADFLLTNIRKMSFLDFQKCILCATDFQDFLAEIKKDDSYDSNLVSMGLLTEAVQGGNQDIIEFLVEDCKCDVTTWNADRYSAVMAAVESENETTLKYLCSRAKYTQETLKEFKEVYKDAPNENIKKILQPVIVDIEKTIKELSASRSVNSQSSHFLLRSSPVELRDNEVDKKKEKYRNLTK